MYVIDEETKEYIIDLEEECENLSEYNRTLIQKIEYLNDIIDKLVDGDEYRICDDCNEVMFSGYCVNDSEYYCSDECLHSHYTEDEYKELYNEDCAYWTEWE